MTSETRIRLYQSVEQPCDYLPNQLSSSLFVDPSLPLSTAHNSLFAEHGFRRSGSQIYRPACRNCSACIATRLPVSIFQCSRNQRRVLKKNRDIKLTIQPAAYHDEYYDLYIRYQQSRHAGGTMVESSPAGFSDFLISNWCETKFFEYRLNGRLLAVAVTDQLTNALSAVYTFFEPELPERSLGVLSVLSQIEEAKSTEKEWLYLGYWIENCQKMAYKAKYKPLEGFINERWQPLGQKG